MLRPFIGAALLAASTALFAQAPADASKAPQRKQRFDCSQAEDPKACEERRAKLRDAAKKAREACESRPQGERRDCMRTEMCKQAKDPAQCEARAKAHAEDRKERQKQRAEKRKQRMEQNQKK
ncbi:MAG TPA: hypothetical protein VEB41_15790 [Burkholderiales bacterium]|nr:hypothetical protein [Burkholderiales bacterium]